MQRPRVQNCPLLLLATLAFLAVVFLSFLNHSPNRLVTGQPIRLLSLGLQGHGLTVLAGLLVAASMRPQTRRLLDAVVLVAAALLVATVFVAGVKASGLSITSSAIARTSLGSGFWIMVSVAALIVADTLSRVGHSALVRLSLLSVLVFAGTIMAGTGHLNELSIVKEYTSKSDVFHQAVVRHGVIVVATLVPTLLLGVPLGILMFRKPAVGKVLLPGLNIIQTIPSIALFGLLMAPLTALVMAVPWLRTMGISGIGLAPAVIALTLYCVLPIVRNTNEGLAQVPRPVVDAARGMGMTERQVFWQVQMPLALPVFLSGLRITIVQAIGLAAVAALIGAGGLGSIMFQGLFSNALDLVLLGALPIVVMVVTVDTLLKVGVNALNRNTR
jgi:osmoprotectant transport system permease protein